jgi:hypothetical protein
MIAEKDKEKKKKKRENFEGKRLTEATLLFLIGEEEKKSKRLS